MRPYVKGSLNHSLMSIHGRRDGIRLDDEGRAIDPKVTKQPYFSLRKGEMSSVNGMAQW